MMNPIRVFVMLVALTLSLGIVGCGDKNTEPDNSAGEINLTDDFGGYKATNETPAFGDSEMSGEGNEAANDPLSARSDVDSLKNDPEVNVYSVEFLWGHFEMDSTETDITDWSGTISVERGAVVAIRLVRFEPGDGIVRPRNSRREIAFRSWTQPSFDGILVFVYDPKLENGQPENSLTFSSGPYSRTFTMTELGQISEVADVGDNQFSVNAIKLERLECGEGFFEGRWVRPAADSALGTFIGRWISADGLMIGHLRGHFGTREDGAKMMFGKWISRAGVFRGFLRGEWGFGDDADPMAENFGWFNGDLFDRDENIIGEYEGNWVQRRPENGHNEGANDDDRRTKHGLFRGQWRQICE